MYPYQAPYCRFVEMKWVCCFGNILYCFLSPHMQYILLSNAVYIYTYLLASVAIIYTLSFFINSTIFVCKQGYKGGSCLPPPPKESIDPNFQKERKQKKRLKKEEMLKKVKSVKKKQKCLVLTLYISVIWGWGGC